MKTKQSLLSAKPAVTSDRWTSVDKHKNKVPDNNTWPLGKLLFSREGEALESESQASSMRQI